MRIGRTVGQGGAALLAVTAAVMVSGCQNGVRVEYNGSTEYTLTVARVPGVDAVARARMEAGGRCRTTGAGLFVLYETADQDKAVIHYKCEQPSVT